MDNGATIAALIEALRAALLSGRAEAIVDAAAALQAHLSSAAGAGMDAQSRQLRAIKACALIAGDGRRAAERALGRLGRH